MRSVAIQSGWIAHGYSGAKVACETGTHLSVRNYAAQSSRPTGGVFMARLYILTARWSAEKREGVPVKLAAALAAVSLTLGTPAFAETVRLPPLDKGSCDEHPSEESVCRPATHTHAYTTLGAF